MIDVAKCPYCGRDAVVVRIGGALKLGEHISEVFTYQSWCKGGNGDVLPREVRQVPMINDASGNSSDGR